MARKVKAMKAKPATSTPVSAIAVLGRLNKGTSGAIALRNTPKTMATKYRG